MSGAGMSGAGMSGPGRSPTIAEVLAPALARQPSAPAVVARSGTLSYAGLDQAAAAAAGALWELGVRPGDRVAACLPNDLAIVAAFHGAQRIGAIWTGINESAAGQEQQVLADLARPSVVLAGARCAVRGYRVLDAAAWTRRTAAAAPAPAVALDPDAPAGIAFTSGTTGVPKGIVHSQRNMLLPGAVLVATRGWDASLRKGDCLPLTLLNMMVLSTLLVAQAGGCAVIMDRRDVAGVAEWISRERVTVWNGVPAQLHDLARRPEPGLDGLRGAGAGDLRPDRGADGSGDRPARRAHPARGERPGAAAPGRRRLFRRWPAAAGGIGRGAVHRARR